MRIRCSTIETRLSRPLRSSIASIIALTSVRQSALLGTAARRAAGSGRGGNPAGGGRRVSSTKELTVDGSASFTMGVEARCSDGVCGRVAQVVLDPIHDTVTHLIV